MEKFKYVSIIYYPVAKFKYILIIHYPMANLKSFCVFIILVPHMDAFIFLLKILDDRFFSMKKLAIGYLFFFSLPFKMEEIKEMH